MKYIKTILIWVVFFIAMGMVFSYFTEVENKIFAFKLSASIGLINGIAGAIGQYFSSKSKIKIFKKAMRLYKGYFNLKKEPVIVIEGRKIILGYKFEQLGYTAYEYVISHVFISDKEMSILQECDKKYEFETRENQHYIIFYSPWGYKGHDFITHIENQLDKMQICLTNNKTNTP